MGQRGPGRIPTANLKIHGSRRGKDRAKTELDAPKGIPSAPDWLNESARAVWSQLIPTLAKTPNLLSLLDENALARYCDTFARWKALTADIHAFGETYEIHNDKTGTTTIMGRQEVWIASQLAQQLTRLEAAFGMTPSARAGLSLGGKGGTDEDETKQACGF